MNKTTNMEIPPELPPTFETKKRQKILLDFKTPTDGENITLKQEARSLLESARMFLPRIGK